MSGKSPSFQFYPQDWLSSPRVMLMKPDERGAYIQLLCYDWTNDGIPNDDEELAILSGFNGSLTKVKGCFNKHPTKDNYLTNERLLSEREKQRKWREKCSKAGKASALSRSKPKKKNGSSTKVARVVEQKGNTSTSSSISNNKKNKQKKCVNANAEMIYHFYPRKVGKGTAIKAIIKAMQSISYEELLQKVREFATTQLGKDPQYIPHCSTWMNGQRWLDEPDSNQQSELPGMTEEQQKAAKAEWDRRTKGLLDQ